MRTIKRLVTAAVATAILTLPLLLVVPSAKAAGPDTDQLIRNGRVVSMTDTAVQIKEWGGNYTYQLSPTGRQTLDAARIRPGDEVQFSVYSPWGVANNFEKLSGPGLGG